MTLREELNGYVNSTFGSKWSRRNGQKVPDDGAVGLGSDAVDLDATVLYADLADSTGLVEGYYDWFAAEVYKTYLYCAAKIIRNNNGVITAYDGDRVMAVYMGDAKNTDAVRTALQINGAVVDIIRPRIAAIWPQNTFALNHKVGVDTSKLMVAKTGIRGGNDLVWVGTAANNAAKLAALDAGYNTYISSKVRDAMDSSVRIGVSPVADMWTYLGERLSSTKVYGSTWQWSL